MKFRAENLSDSKYGYWRAPGSTSKFWSILSAHVFSRILNRIFIFIYFTDLLFLDLSAIEVLEFFVCLPDAYRLRNSFHGVLKPKNTSWVKK